MKTRLSILSVLVLSMILGGYKLNYKNNSQLSNRVPASAQVSGVKKAWMFQFKDLSKNKFQIKKEAATYEEAFKLASKECFNKLTHGTYPGEEKGLDIIDICVNPKI